MACIFFHKWVGCKCEKCGEVRDTGHEWEGCKCKVCGTVRNTGHDWVMGIYCDRCYTIETDKEPDRKAIESLSLPDLERLVHDLRSVSWKRKDHGRGLMMFIAPNDPDSKRFAAEQARLFEIYYYVSDRYIVRSLAETNNPSETFDRLAGMFSAEPKNLIGKYNPENPDNAVFVLKAECRKHAGIIL